jgi:glycerol-3-phosphate acyltransferase PlsY
LLATIVIAGSYLLGSISLSYIGSKWIKGKDLTRVGSGTTGTANVWATVSRKIAVIAFFFDVAKGAAPVLVCRYLNFELPIQMASGIAAVVGHNWSIFLCFRGGRGIATIVGLLLVLAPKEFAVLLLFALLGVLLHDLALFILLLVIALPLLSWWLGREQVLITGELIILFLVIAKRLEANRMWTSEGKWWEVLAYRLLFDRDIRDREAWISRGNQDNQTRDGDRDRD